MKSKLANLTTQSNPYNKVRILGPDHNEAFEHVLNDEEFNSDPNCILIGDGTKPVKLEQIKQKLGGRIDESTQIEIHAHGMSYPDILKMRKGHAIELSRPFHIPEDTISLLKELDSLTISPLQIFIRSCYSGAANKYIKELKPGSTLVTSASDNEESYYDPSLSLNFTPSLSPEEKFLHIIRFMPREWTFNKKLDNGEIFQYTYRPHSLDFAPDQAAEYIVKAENDFIIRCVEKARADSRTFAHEFPPLPKDEEALQNLINRAEKIMELSKGKTLVPILKSYPTAKLDGAPILHWAARTENARAFNKLIKAGADPNSQDQSGTPILYWAARKDNPDAFDRLIKAQANLNAQDQSGTPILYKAAGSDNAFAFDRLIHAGADPNATFSDGCPILLKAAEQNQPDIFEKLLQVGADPNKHHGSRTLTDLLQGKHELQTIFDKFKSESLQTLTDLENKKDAFDKSRLGRLSGHKKVTAAEIDNARERYMQFLNDDEKNAYIGKRYSAEIQNMSSSEILPSQTPHRPSPKGSSNGLFNI